MHSWKTILYWNDRKGNGGTYFWVHYLFGDLYKSDDKFKQLWDLTPKISAVAAFFMLHQGFEKKLSDEVKNHINEIKTPLYKLTYKIKKKCNGKSNLVYLLNKFDLKFMHVPKTGGTSIENAAKKNNLLWGRFDKSLKCSKWLKIEI